MVSLGSMGERAGPLSCHDRRRSELSLLVVHWRIPLIFVSTGRSGSASIRGPADPLCRTLPAVTNCLCCVQVSRSIGSLLLPRISNRHRKIRRFPQSSCQKGAATRIRPTLRGTTLVSTEQPPNDTSVPVQLDNRYLLLRPRCSVDKAANDFRWIESLVVGWHADRVGRPKSRRKQQLVICR